MFTVCSDWFILRCRCRYRAHLCSWHPLCFPSPPTDALQSRHREAKEIALGHTASRWRCVCWTVYLMPSSFFA